MPIKHSLLTGADLHEPKGIEAANGGTVYTANGAGSGVWVKPAFIMKGPKADGNDPTPGYLSTPVAINLKTATFILTDDPVSSADDLVFVLKDSGSSVLATATFPVATSFTGSTQTIVADIPLAAGDYLTLEVSGTQTSSPCFVESFFLAELSL